MAKYSSMKGKRLGSDFWKSRIAEHERSGLTQQAYVDMHGLSIQTFCRWRKRLSKDATALVLAQPVRFVELTAETVAEAPGVRLCLGSVRLELSELPPPAYLAAVHNHVEAARRC